MTKVKDGERKRTYAPRSTGGVVESSAYSFRLSTSTPEGAAARTWLNDYLSDIEGHASRGAKISRLMESVIGKQEGYTLEQPPADEIETAVIELREELDSVRQEIESRQDMLRRELREMITSMIRDNKTMRKVKAAHDDFESTGQIGDDVVDNILEGFKVD